MRETDAAILDRLEKALAAPPVRVTVAGSGLPAEQSLVWDAVALVSRYDLERAVALARQAPGVG